MMIFLMILTSWFIGAVLTFYVSIRWFGFDPDDSIDGFAPYVFAIFWMFSAPITLLACGLMWGGKYVKEFAQIGAAQDKEKKRINK